MHQVKERPASAESMNRKSAGWESADRGSIDMETRQLMTLTHAIRKMQSSGHRAAYGIFTCEECREIFGACCGSTEECEQRYFMYVEEC